MKANETPEKIYLQEPTKVRTEKKYDNDVEYIRTDAFIGQMKAWLMGNSANYMMYDPLTSSACLEVEKMIEDFEEYLKKWHF